MAKDAKNYQVANVLEVGGDCWPLRQFIANAVSRSRRFRIIRLGNAALVTSDIVGAERVALPPDVSFTTLTKAGMASLAALVGACKSARLLALHGVDDHELADRLATFFQPDVVLWPRSAPPLVGFPQDREVFDATILGLGDHNLCARPSFNALRDALVVQADAVRRGRAQNNVNVYGVEEIILADGFWPLDRDDRTAWAWTGPHKRATIVLPPPPPGPLRITVFFFATQIPIAPSSLKLQVEGQLGLPRFLPEDTKIELDLPGTPLESPCLVLRLSQAKLAFTPDASRQIGVALHKIKVEPLR